MWISTVRRISGSSTSSKQFFVCSRRDHVSLIVVTHLSSLSPLVLIFENGTLIKNKGWQNRNFIESYRYLPHSLSVMRAVILLTSIKPTQVSVTVSSSLLFWSSSHPHFRQRMRVCCLANLSSFRNIMHRKYMYPGTCHPALIHDIRLWDTLRYPRSNCLCRLHEMRSACQPTNWFLPHIFIINLQLRNDGT